MKETVTTNAQNDNHRDSAYDSMPESPEQKLPFNFEKTDILDENFLKTEPSDLYGPVYYYYKQIIDGNNIGTEVKIIGDEGNIINCQIFWNH